jgi:hypothetical protein
VAGGVVLHVEPGAGTVWIQNTDSDHERLLGAWGMGLQSVPFT